MHARADPRRRRHRRHHLCHTAARHTWARCSTASSASARTEAIDHPDQASQRHHCSPSTTTIRSRLPTISAPAAPAPISRSISRPRPVLPRLPVSTSGSAGSGNFVQFGPLGTDLDTLVDDIADGQSLIVAFARAVRAVVPVSGTAAAGGAQAAAHVRQVPALAIAGLVEAGVSGDLRHRGAHRAGRSPDRRPGRSRRADARAPSGVGSPPAR